MTKQTVNIYTDGGCWPNPGYGGWGAILMFGDKTRKISGSCENATSSRMELTAAIEALKCLKYPCRVILTTDSKDLMNGYTIWLPKWIERNWLTTQKQPVENQDLWRELMEVAKSHDISWYHVRGHSGNIYNEECDRLATVAREELAERMQKNDE